MMKSSIESLNKKLSFSHKNHNNLCTIPVMIWVFTKSTLLCTSEYTFETVQTSLYDVFPCGKLSDVFEQTLYRTVYIHGDVYRCVPSSVSSDYYFEWRISHTHYRWIVFHRSGSACAFVDGRFHGMIYHSLYNWMVFHRSVSVCEFVDCCFDQKIYHNLHIWMVLHRSESACASVDHHFYWSLYHILYRRMVFHRSASACEFVDCCLH